MSTEQKGSHYRDKKQRIRLPIRENCESRGYKQQYIGILGYL